MNKGPIKRNILLFLIIFVLIQGFLWKPYAFPLSIEEERILGNKFLLEVRKYFKLVDDDFVNQFINDLGHHLIGSLETRPFPFRFYVINSKALNAFAAPGGHIFVYSGLIEGMDEIDELASVVCHEIAHVTARHIAARIEQGKKIGLATMAGVLAGAFIGGKAASAVMTGSIAAGIQAQLHYSRNDERQADQLGFKYMDAAGFNPKDMITTLNKIQRGQGFGSDRVPSYLRTHPSGPERMADLDILLSNYNAKSETGQSAKLRAVFPFFKAMITVACATPQEAEQIFKRQLEKEPGSPSALFGLGSLSKARSEYEVAIDHFEEALKGMPDYPPILKKLGETYIQADQDKEGIKILERVLKIDERDKSALFLLAKAYQDLEEYAKAIALYERLKTMEPVKNEVFYNLGMSYGREDKLALAHYHFGVHFKRLENLEKAKYHLEKAEGLSGGNPVLRDQIQRARRDISTKK